jgi:hypothetical protein
MVKNSHIAAAKLKVAIAEKTGERVPDWIRELAARDLTDTTSPPAQDESAAHPVQSVMPLASSSFQTQLTDSGVAGILDAKVTAMDVLDPAENNEKTSLLEADDEFDVRLTWQLTGTATPVISGAWIVSLYSENIDGIGEMTGLISGPAIIPITGGPSPLTFQHTFKVAPPIPKEGLYRLTATLNHSPTGDPAKISEMFGYAESTPIQIRKFVVETN